MDAGKIVLSLVVKTELNHHVVLPKKQQKQVVLQKNKLSLFKKIKVKKRYFNYIVPIADNGFTILNKRAEKGIWANLYEFPLVETMGVIGIKELKNEIHKLAVLDTSFELSMYNEKEIVHKLSHQHIYTRFWIATTDKLMEPKVSFSEIEKYPVPVLIANFINEFSF